MLDARMFALVESLNKNERWRRFQYFSSNRDITPLCIKMPRPLTQWHFIRIITFSSTARLFYRWLLAMIFS